MIDEIRIIAAVAVLAITTWLLGRRLWRRAPDSIPFKAVVDGLPLTQAKWLSIPLVFVGMAALMAAWLLLFVAFVCFFYAAALAHGEVGQLLGVLTPTAGNILFLSTFPTQMFIMGLFILLLVLGGFQIVLGPLPLRGFGLIRVDGVRPLVRRLAGLLAVTAGLELTRTVVAGGIAAPEGFLEFFARGGQAPLMDPTGLALLASLAVFAAVLIIIRYQDRS
jgi:hypothetical protein